MSARQSSRSPRTSAKGWGTSRRDGDPLAIEAVRQLDEPGGPPNSLLVGRVAQMHYIDRMTNLAIAEQLGLSRFRVARLIDTAIDSGIVTIQVANPGAVDVELSQRLRERFGLAEALVLSTDAVDADDSVGTHRGVCRLAARFLQDYLTDGASLGVSWGTTIDGVAAELEMMSGLPMCDVVQMAGNLTTLENSMHAGDVLRRFSNQLGGAAYALHAPLVVPSVEVAVGIRSEQSVARTLAMMGGVDIALVGIGSWQPPASHFVDVLPPQEVAATLRLGPRADVCARVLDEDGNELDPTLAARTIGASLDDLRAVRMTVGVATGTAKGDAVHIALKASVLNAVVTDAAIAERCLES